ncbi:hypothetical protein E4N62_44655 [Streptomyces sp. MNU76]|nr:hypothetical protein [Streptomyces sp. MNU76]MCC9711684.1 hypothetical protein [Streptomyces sp. MNU76]
MSHVADQVKEKRGATATRWRSPTVRGLCPQGRDQSIGSKVAAISGAART